MNVNILLWIFCHTCGQISSITSGNIEFKSRYFRCNMGNLIFAYASCQLALFFHNRVEPLCLHSSLTSFLDLCVVMYVLIYLARSLGKSHSFTPFVSNSDFLTLVRISPLLSSWTLSIVRLVPLNSSLVEPITSLRLRLDIVSICFQKTWCLSYDPTKHTRKY